MYHMSSERKRKRNPNAFLEKRLGKIELALWGKDGRGGMVKDIANILAELEKSRDWRRLAITVLSGGVVAFIAWVLSHL